MHRKNLIIILSVLFLISLATTVAFARNSRCLDCEITTEESSSGGGKGGGKKSSLLDVPMIDAGNGGVIINIKALNGRGFMVGLGNEDIEVILTATALLDNITCTNPGGQVVEVQPVHVTVTEIEFIPSEDFTKNGSTTFALQAVMGSTDNLCPNGNWTMEADGLWQGPADISVNGKVVHEATCNQSNPDADVTCQ